MRKTHDPAGYAFDVLVDLAQQGNEFARDVVAAHPSNGLGKLVCVGCFNLHKEAEVTRTSQGFVICRECYPQSSALVDFGNGRVDIIHADRPVVSHSTRVAKPDPVSPLMTAPVYEKDGEGFKLKVPPAEADYVAIEMRALATMGKKRPRGRPRKGEESPTGRAPSEGPEMQTIARPAKPGTKLKIGSPEWKARMAKFMGARA